MSRFYDPALAHFISADTVVPEPGNLKSYDRYAYVNGNPIKYNDPSGHRVCDEDDCLEHIRNGTGKNFVETTVSYILKSGFQDTQSMLRAYMRAHPNYDPCKDHKLNADLPSKSLVATAKMQADDPKQYQPSVITLKSLIQGAQAIAPVIIKAVDINEAITGNGIPISWGYGIDIFLQYTKDREINNGTERLFRAVIVGMEGSSVQQVSLAVMGGSGALGVASGPGDLAIMGTTYLATNVGLTLFYDQINEERLFPYLHDRFAHQR